MSCDWRSRLCNWLAGRVKRSSLMHTQTNFGRLITRFLQLAGRELCFASEYVHCSSTLLTQSARFLRFTAWSCSREQRLALLGRCTHCPSRTSRVRLPSMAMHDLCHRLLPRSKSVSALNVSCKRLHGHACYMGLVSQHTIRTLLGQVSWLEIHTFVSRTPKTTSNVRTYI